MPQKNLLGIEKFFFTTFTMFYHKNILWFGKHVYPVIYLYILSKINSWKIGNIQCAHLIE
jgi:hypothetical protein